MLHGALTSKFPQAPRSAFKLHGQRQSTLTSPLDRHTELPEGSSEITIGGVDIRNIALSHLRGNIGIVLQEPFLFSKSLGHHFRTVPIATILKACASMPALPSSTTPSTALPKATIPADRRARRDDFRRSETASLSPVCSCRTRRSKFSVTLFPPWIWKTDAEIRESIRTKNVRGTTILIAHRITTIMNADQIIVMDKGHIVRRSTHETLSKEDGIYKRIRHTALAAT